MREETLRPTWAAGQRLSGAAGRLTGFKWKLVTSIGSSDADRLGRVFVAVELRLSGLSGVEQVRTAELTLAQFAEFAKQLKEIQSAMADVL